MNKFKILGLFFAICNLAFSEETVLVPTDNGGYIRVPISEIMPQEKKEKIKEIKKEEEIKATEKIIEKTPVRREVIPISENTPLDDLLTVSMNYDYKKIEKESLDNNKNPIENKVITDFISNSRTNERVTEAMYLFNINTFYTKTKFEDEKNEDLKNYGAIASIQYGINDDINIKFNAGYGENEFLDDKSDNMFFSLDYSYSPQYRNDSDTEWEIGTILGYFNGENDYYRSDDMFIGLLYTNIKTPITETIYFDTDFESTILSNKIGFGIRKNIFFFDNIDLSFKLISDYVFGYKDRDKKIYTHLDEDDPTIKVELEISDTTEYGITLKSFYDFTYESCGITFEYKF